MASLHIIFFQKYVCHGTSFMHFLGKINLHKIVCYPSILLVSNIVFSISESKKASLNKLVTDPQKSVPSIAAIGYNGVQLWQSGMIFIL